MEISSADGRRSLTVTVPTFNTMGHATKETLDTVGHATKETLDTVGHATKETLDTVGQATGRATGGAAKVAMKPIEMARRVLPAKGGLPCTWGSARSVPWRSSNGRWRSASGSATRCCAKAA
ncbi:hypothetical protein ACFQ2Y_42170 [Streptomyces malaysiensis subsp. malaysiensis]